jgi:hypothetical protein
MAGASPPYNTIKENLIVELCGQLRDGKCRTYPSDQRVKTDDHGYDTYPDLIIPCLPPNPAIGMGDAIALGSETLSYRRTSVVDLGREGRGRSGRRTRFEKGIWARRPFPPCRAIHGALMR